jgi:hypothetical protein
VPTGEASIVDGLLGPELWRLRREELLREAEGERLARVAAGAPGRRWWGRLLPGLMARLWGTARVGGRPAGRQTTGVPVASLAAGDAGGRRATVRPRRCGGKKAAA